MINHPYKDLYFGDSVHKNLYITYMGNDGEPKVIDNSEIKLESMSLTESICSDDELTFGSCETSVFKISILERPESLFGKGITVTQTIDGYEDTPLQIGVYKVVSWELDSERNYRELIAYDFMYNIVNDDVAEWYKSLEFPLSLRDFRDSFFAYMGIEQVETDLANDDMTVEKTIDVEQLSSRDVIQAICEINGAFGHITRDNKFKYIVLPDMIKGLYPSNTLFPADNLYPVQSNFGRVNRATYSKYRAEEYEVKKITRLQIRQEQNDIGTVVGVEGNDYIVQGNFLVYGKDAEELTAIASALLDTIGGVSYRPVSLVAMGNPCFEVGEGYKFVTDNDVIYTYILERNLKGIQALFDEFSAEGKEYYTENVNGVNSQITQLKGKTSVIERTVNGLTSTVSDLEKSTTTKFEQTDEAISLRAEKNKLISEINASAEGIKISASKVDISGVVTFSDLSSSGKTTINADNITSGTIRGRKLEGCTVGAEQGLTVDGNKAVINGAGFFLLSNGFDSWQSDVVAGQSVFKVASGGYCTFTNMITATNAYVSDKRLKKNINYDIAKYDDLFNGLKPCSFEYREGHGLETDKTHIGFIANDILDYAEENNLALVNTSDPNRYTLDKGELIALCVNEIQKLKTRVSELEEQLNAKSV